LTDTAKLIERGLRKAGPGRLALAAPFELRREVAEPFVEDGRVAGLVGEFAPDKDIPELPLVGRWTSPDRSRFALFPNPPGTILFLGTTSQIGGRILLECARRRVKQLVHLDRHGTDFAVTKPFRALKARALPLLLSRMGRTPILARLGEHALQASGRSFRDGFRELVEETRFLRLPPEAFDQNSLVLFSPTLGPGGAERQMSYCARGIARSGQWRVGVAAVDLTPPINDFYKGSMTQAGCTVELVPSPSEAYQEPELASWLERFDDRHAPSGLDAVARAVAAHALFLRRVRPGLVHSWMDAANVPAGLAAAIVGVPKLVMSGRSLAPNHFAFFQLYMREGYRAILTRTNAVFLNNSRAGAADYARWLGIDPNGIAVVRNGFEFPTSPPSQAAADLRRRLGFDPRDIILGGLLRFSEEKRPKLWLEAAIRFVRASPHHGAVAFGDGHMRPDLLRIVEGEGLSGRIHLPGVTKDAWASLTAMDIFLLTSRVEGLPNGLIEAQAMGVPPVSVDVGGVSEALIAGETGILVEDESASALGAACLALASDPERRRELGAAGARFVRDCFAADRMVDHMLRIYERTATPAMTEPFPG
jgi:glycosyltransferase involved in cell wall biosynthesis